MPAPTSLSEVLDTFSTVVVTGGSSGIGKSFIELGIRVSERLVICNLSRHEPVTKISGGRLNHFPCDLSQPGAIDRVARDVGQFLQREVPKGRILLINNSGFGAYGHFPKPNLAHQLEMIDVNVRAVVHLTGAMLPLLQARGGVVVNVASTAAFQPTAYMATYGASKAFVLDWTLALNEEWRGTGLSALALCPGPTGTDFFRRAGLTAGSVSPSLSMTSEQVVEATVSAIGHGRSLVVPGWKNKAYTAISSKLGKPFVARLGAKVLARFRLKQVAP
jgi:uncharacterized protein